MGAPDLRVVNGRLAAAPPELLPDIRVVARILIDALYVAAERERQAEAWGASNAAYGFRCQQAALRGILGRIRGLLPDHNRDLVDV